jgi:energy-coupling factor transporter ATP-binding protein EcfA2
VTIFELIPSVPSVLAEDPIPLSQETILLGPNGSGKSTVLRQIEQALMGERAGEKRRSQGSLPVLLLEPGLASLSILKIAADNLLGYDGLFETIGSMWTNDDGSPEDWAPEIEDDDFYDAWPSDPVMYVKLFHETISYSLFSEAMHADFAGSRDQLRLLCQEVASRTIIAFREGYVGIMVNVRAGHGFNSLVLEMESSGFDFSELEGNWQQPTCRVASVVSRSIDENAPQFVWLSEPMEESIFRRGRVRENRHGYHSEEDRILALRLDDETSSLLAETQGWVTRFALQIFLGTKGEESERFSNEGLPKPTSEDFAAWLLDEENPFAFEIDASSGVRVNPLIVRAIEVLNDVLSDLIPTFLMSEGEFSVRMLPPSTWAVNSQRIEVVATRGSQSLPLSDLSTGISRYATLCLRLGMQLLLRAVLVGVTEVRDLSPSNSAEDEDLLDDLFDPFVPSDETRNLTLEEQREKHDVLGLRLTPFSVEDFSDLATDERATAVFEELRRIESLITVSDSMLRGLAHCVSEYASQNGLDADEIANLVTEFDAEVKTFRDARVAVNEKARSLYILSAVDVEPLRTNLSHHFEVIETTDRVNLLSRKYGLVPMEAVLLLDEPEVHLHPLAVRSVKQWIQDVSPYFKSVVIATHSLVIADVDLPTATTLLAERVGGDSRFFRRGVDRTRENMMLLNDLGLTESDIFLRYKYFLFVEGIHERVIFETYYGQDLENAGIRVINLHGLGNAAYLTTTDFIWAFGKPIGVFADNHDPFKDLDADRVSETHEDSTMRGVIRNFVSAGRTFDRFGHREEDILFYVDSSVAREFANSKFSTWQDAYETAVAAGPKGKWKKYVKRTYGLNIDGEGSLEAISEMAMAVRDRDLIPVELTSEIHRAIAKAFSWEFE